MTDSQLLLWFKDKILGNVNDPTNYLDQTVNIEVGKLLPEDRYFEYVKLVTGEVTQRVYDTHGNLFFQEPDSAFKVYGDILSLSNRDKLIFLHKLIGA